MSILIGINETVIEATGDELANILEIRKEAEEAQLKKEANETARAALLDRLGITEDEAKLLLA